MPFFGVPIRNGLPIGLGSVAGFGVQQFDPSQLFEGGTVAGAWYDPSDLSTMFDSSAGTTPVAMPGQGAAVPVGLMLDKSQGLVLGPQTELVTNGTFNTDIAGWTFTGSGGTATWNAGAARIAMSTSSTKQFSQGISVVAGKSYTITGTVTPVSGTLSASFTLRTTNDFATSAYIAGQGFSASGGTINFKYVAPTTTTVFVCIQSFTTISTFDIDNISIVEWIQGNHAISFNNTTARPELRARVNLLTYSEEFDNAVWTKRGFATPVSGQTDPNGGTTAWSITEDNTDNNPALLFLTGINNTVSRTFRVWLRASSNISISLSTQGSTSPGNISVTTSWQEFSVTQAVASITTGPHIGGFGTIARNSGVTIFVWHPDLRPANIGANVPAYQRIADANTYDTSGFPLYLRFDGIDDSMYTPANLDLSGTDKVSVFAGVRKLSDAAFGIIAELSADINSNGGTFNIAGPTGTVTPVSGSYSFRSRGTAFGGLTWPTNYVAPITNVLTGLGDISGDSSILRINGTQAASSTADQGTGNYSTYPLYIGSRNNAGNWFNGHLHSLIIAGSAVSAGNISATEQWVAGKTGLQL